MMTNVLPEGNKIVDLQQPKPSSSVTKKKVFDLNEITSTERFQFTWCGVYPVRTTNKWRKLLHNVQLLILGIFSSILIFSMIISLILGVDSLAEGTAILYYLISQGSYVFKLVNYLLQRHKVPALEEHLKNDITYKFYKIFGHEELDSIVQICWAVGLGFRICACFLLLFFILTPLVTEDILLPLAGWMPVDKEDYRASIFSLQICCFALSCMSHVSLDIYTTYYISIAVGELRLLKLCFANIDYTMDENGARKDELLNQDDAMKMDVENDSMPKLPATSLEEVALLHKHVITLTNMIEDIFSNGIFIQFLASVGTICLTGFQMMVVKPGSMQFFNLLFFFGCMLFQVILYCGFGNEIIYESTGINEACYMSNWYEAEPRYKKMLLLIMERSKRPIFLTAGKLFILSLTTLVMIGKTSYSYFAVLQRLYKGD